MTNTKADTPRHTLYSQIVIYSCLLENNIYIYNIYIDTITHPDDFPTHTHLVPARSFACDGSVGGLHCGGTAHRDPESSHLG